MKPLRGIVWGCALVLCGVSAAPANAAWCNAVQVCWFRHRAAPAVSYYAAPAPCNACAPQCTTSYVQRSYYQPVTTYQTKSYYEPVTTYRTSYYYEPVRGYTYTSYYDPCSCGYQQVATPTVSYQLRAQNCPVQSWVQRCASVPVTSYQQSFYWEPVTSCCTPTVAALPAQGCCGQPGVGATIAPPGVSEQRQGSGAGVSETPNRNANPGFQSYQSMPPASGSSLRLLPPRSDVPAGQPSTAPPASVKLDRIASNATKEVQGKVVRGDRLPLSGARLLFIDADRAKPRRTVDTGADGQFNVKLGSGEWLVYIHGSDGQPVFQRKIEVNHAEQNSLVLVKR